MGHKIRGCLLVKLFALHTTAFKKIFPTKTPPKPKAKNTKPKASKTTPKESNTKSKARDTKSKAGNMKSKAKKKGALKCKAKAKKASPPSRITISASKTMYPTGYCWPFHPSCSGISG